MTPETVFGLPVHPLVVHAPVVLIPLTALGLVAVAVVPRWRRAYGPLVAAGSVAAFFSALAARLTGEAFEESLDWALAVVAAGAATVQVVRTGHAGTEAVWNPTG